MSATTPRQLPIWSAPLVPVALALTAGVVADRHWVVPLVASLSIGMAFCLAWLIFANSANKWLTLVYLWGSVAGSGPRITIGIAIISNRAISAISLIKIHNPRA